MLTEREWNSINNILLELYSVEGIHTLFRHIMTSLHILIRYSKGYIVLLDDEERIIENLSCFVGMDEKIVKEYINYYYDEDYLKYLYEISVESTVFQDSKIISDEMRKETLFYKQFLNVIDGQFGCGILIVHNGKLLGVLNMFKSSKLGDFTDKDVYILEVLKFHIENMVRRAIKSGENDAETDKSFDDMTDKFELTKREKEVLKLLCAGFSNAGISDMLAVSLSTTKSHIYNIYTKTGVNSRTQLINMLYNGNE